MTNSAQNNNLDQLVVRAFHWIDESLQQSLRKRGGPAITHSQSMVIMSIGDDSARSSAIAAGLGVSRQAIHQSLRDLIRVGIVELVPDPTDGRAKLVRLSKKGAPVRRMAAEILAAVEVELGEKIGKRNLVNLRSALEQDWGDPVSLD